MRYFIRGPLPLLTAALVAVIAVGCGRGVPEAYVRSTVEPAPRVELEAAASVTVLEGQPVTREIRELTALPRELGLRPNRTVRLLAAAFDQNGVPIETDIQYQWKVDDPRAGTIEPATSPGAPPLFRASNEVGDYPQALIVSALVSTPGGLTGTSRHVRVIVEGDAPPPTVVEIEAIPPVIEAAPGQIVRLQAVGYDGAGRIVPETRFDWQTANSDVGAINRLGYLTISASPGEYPSAVRVVGQAGDSSAETAITLRVVEPRAVSTRPTAHILPANARIITGAPFKFQAVTLDAVGRPLRVNDVKWVVHDSEAGTIGSDGSFVAGSEPGTYLDAVEYIATTGGATAPMTVSAKASVTIRPVVLPNPLAKVEAIPGHLLLAGGETFILRAIAMDAGDRITGGVTIDWQVLDPRAGSVDSLGQFKAGRTPGTFEDAVRVTARQQTPSGVIATEAVASVTITGQMTTLEVLPANAMVKAGQAIQFRAIARDENGVQIPGVLFDWSVADGAAGRIGLGGLFEAGQTAGSFTGGIRVKATQRLGR